MPIVLLLLLTSALGAPIRRAAADEPIRVIINGRDLHLDFPPVLEQGRMLVPLRTVAESLGADLVAGGCKMTH